MWIFKIHIIQLFFIISIQNSLLFDIVIVIDSYCYQFCRSCLTRSMIIRLMFKLLFTGSHKQDKDPSCSNMIDWLFYAERKKKFVKDWYFGQKVLNVFQTSLNQVEIALI